MQISGLEELLNTGHGLVTEAAVPAAGIPHASEAYNRIIEKARAGLTSYLLSAMPMFSSRPSLFLQPFVCMLVLFYNVYDIASPAKEAESGLKRTVTSLFGGVHLLISML